MTESGYDGNKRLHCGSVRLDREQPVYTPSSLFSWPELQLPSLRTLRPPVPEPGLCELRGLNTTTSAPSPQGEGSELSSFPSPYKGETKKKLKNPPDGGRGTGKDLQLHPNLEKSMCVLAVLIRSLHNTNSEVK